MADMKQNRVILYLFFTTIWMALGSCQAPSISDSEGEQPAAKGIDLQTGAEQTGSYLPKLRGKKVGLVVNHTSNIRDVHLVDSLHNLGISIVRIFAPEHGFRGDADAGAHISDGKDITTGAPIISLYGLNKKPKPEHLEGVDVVVYDIQDVGARFYTYISTMSYVMEACAEWGVPFMVLDRPNPNGHYIDGPVLDPEYSSFVGLHPVPVVHGMTVGEYAQMVNGEGWLKNGLEVDLTVVPCAGYTHQSPYNLPIKPSPNLPNMRSIYLYPSLCFFEPTSISIGRGTDKQFQVIGTPEATFGDFHFMPIPKPGAQKPKHEGRDCVGLDLTGLSPESIRTKDRLDLSYLVEVYNSMKDKGAFFTSNSFFDKLAGGAGLRQKLSAGQSEAEIRASWQNDLKAYDEMRQQYLLYPK